MRRRGGNTGHTSRMCPQNQNRFNSSSRGGRGSFNSRGRVVEVRVIVVEDGGTVEDEASEVGGGEGDVAEGGYSCERV